MRPAAQAVFLLGSVLLAVGFVTVAVDAFRRHDRARLDVLFFLGLLLCQPLLGGWAFRLFLVQVFPFALLKLVGHFREIRQAWLWWTLAVAVATPIADAGLSDAGIRGVGRATLLITASVILVSGILLLSEARRSAGVKARRTSIAAWGTGLLGGSLVVSSLSGWFEPARIAAAPLFGAMQGLALICYYFAFATPRPLLSRWRRAEQHRYLSTVMEREPEERGRRAPDDLFQAAVRGAGGAVTFVALRAAVSSRGLTVRATSDTALADAPVMPARGLVGRAIEGGAALQGTPPECEPAVARAVLPHAERVLVAPIVAGARTWGAVVVGQRRGSLFPEDDLAMLEQIARNAATALEHAQLIAERREQERIEADRRLRQVESRVELMLDSIKDYALLVLDAAGRVTAWHPGAEHVFKYTRDEILGQSVAPLYGMRDDEMAAWLEEARLWGRSRGEGPCRRSDDTSFVGTTIVRPLVDEPGSRPGFVVVTHDVTDLRTLEDRLRQGQKMEAIGQLAGGVAHDFNNLLTAILGYADWLALELVGDRRQEQVAEIQKAAERAADLTRQLLAFSRRQMLQAAAIDLNDLIAGLIPMLRRLVGPSVQILDETAPLLPAIAADRSQVERVLVNLAVNARDAMPDGGTLTIRTSDVWLNDTWSSVEPIALAPGPHVLLEVIDTGLGMDEETRRRVFEPFFTTKDVGKGTGLGLSTVYGIVQQMGGAIDLASAPGRGAHFRLFFPQAAGVSAPAAVEARPTTFGRGTETVLLVEDEDVVRRYLANLLESHGYHVLAAEDARAALALTQSFGGRIDLVISDVVMPGSSGPELVRLLGQARPGLSALFISGSADVEIARHTHAVHRDQLLLKPFSSTELLAKIRQIIAAA
jgi:PAS domain S-box-containing protein